MTIKGFGMSRVAGHEVGVGGVLARHMIRLALHMLVVSAGVSACAGTRTDGC